MRDEALRGLPPPNLPVIYLDWNTIQYLRSDDRMTELVAELAEVHVRHACIVPFTDAHLLDATALWSSEGVGSGKSGR